MAPQHDLEKPMDDPYSLVGDSWPSESENSYHTAKVAAEDASTAASVQSESVTDAGSKMGDEHGKTADAVSSGYRAAARQLSEQSRNFTTISAWMEDAAVKVLDAKRHIRYLVRTATPEIRDALDSELKGTPTTPSSADLITKYRSDIAVVASTLTTDLDAIGHSLAGDPGSSRSPSYTSVSTTPTPEHADPRATVAAYNHGQSPEVTPQQLPEMPRAVTAPSSESPSAPSAPSAPTVPHPTLSNLVGGQGSTPSASSPGGTGSPHTSSQGSPSPSPQAHQAPEQHQTSKAPGLPRIPSLPLDGLPVAAAESIATVVSSAAAHQLPTAPSTITPAPSIPASTGITPGVAGTPPMTPVTPAPFTPIGGGGGLTPPAVTQPVTPTPQGTPAAPPPASQQTTQTPTRSPVADATWIQRTYGLAPGIETPRGETALVPAIFVTELPEPEVHLHRVLATIRQAFETSGWSQPLAVATIKRGFEARTVYVTSDALSIHPHGVSLPVGVIPLDEMPSTPTHPDLSGSIMVSEKLKALIPYGWEVQSMLSTVPADEHHQSTEHYQELVEAGELLDCKGSRGRDDVEAGEAMSVFARVAIGSGGCGELDVEGARLRAARWVGVQPAGYLGVLSRWYLADAAECMASGNWAEAVYCSERYLSVVEPKSKAA